MSEHYTAKHIDDLWVPGKSLDEHFPAATPEQISNELSRIHDSVTTTGDILGTIRVPSMYEEVKAVASIDLCEIVRYTARTLASFAGRLDYDRNVYLAGLWEDERFSDIRHIDMTIQPIVQVAMNHEHVPPIDGIELIADHMKQWRKEGVYCVANTSTAPGCELATMRFMQEYLHDCFDGIIFPRNPDGFGKTTKADALSRVIEILNTNGHTPDFALHVDDTVHHIISMLEQEPHPDIHLFVPAYPDNIAVSGLAKNVLRSPSPVASFAAMDEYMKSK